MTFDTATDGGNNGGSTNNLTFSHTCTGSDRLLVVGVTGDQVGGVDDISSVTYAGVNMAFVSKRGILGMDRWLYIYELEGPASGANNVVVTSSGTHYLLAGATSYAGAAQSGQPDGSTTSQSATGATTWTTSLTTTADKCWAVLIEGCNTGGTPPSAGTGLTRRIYDATFGVWGLFDSGADITPAGSYSMTTTRGSASSNAIGHVVASFAPVTVAAITLSEKGLFDPHLVPKAWF